MEIKLTVSMNMKFFKSFLNLITELAKDYLKLIRGSIGGFDRTVAPLAWVPCVPGNPSIAEHWVPEPINF